MLTKNNILLNADAGIYCDNINKNSVSCALIPYYHVYALITGFIMPTLSNASFLISDFSDIKKYEMIANNLLKYNITNLYSVPFIYYILSKIPEIKKYLVKTKHIVSGGIQLSAIIRQEFQSKCNKEIYEGYGLTETTSVSAFYAPDEKNNIDSIGKAIKSCSIKIFNDNNECHIGEIGEICIQGDNVMKGYYNNNEATQKTIVNNWLHTGDLGLLDSEGYVYFKGLKKRMLNVAGHNVYPKEVERYIMMNDNVKNAHIYGEWRELEGHLVKAKIELKNNALEKQKEFKKWCMENITHYKIPKIIEYY